MRKSLPLTLFLCGLCSLLILTICEIKFKANLFQSSVNIQKKITRPPPHGLYYIFKIFEWGMLILTWIALMLTLYLEFNKLTSWKIMLSIWTLALVIDFSKLLFKGTRPSFQNKTLSHNGCECSFGTPSWYTAFLLLFWVLFFENVLGPREFIKVLFNY